MPEFDRGPRPRRLGDDLPSSLDAARSPVERRASRPRAGRPARRRHPFFLMLSVFNCWDVSTPAIAVHSQSLFQTGWFVESRLTQTLIIHVIRTNKIPFLQSRPSAFLMATSAAIMAVGVALPFTPLGHSLGFTALPGRYWPYIGMTLACYVVLAQVVKAWLLRRRWI